MNKKTEANFRKDINEISKFYGRRIVYGTLDRKGRNGGHFVGGIATGGKRSVAYDLIDDLESSARLHQYVRQETQRIILHGIYRMNSKESK